MASAAVVGAVITAGSATAATANPTVTHINCPKNIHVGVPAHCGVSVTDLGKNPTPPLNFVQLKTNVGPNHGTFASITGCTQDPAATAPYCGFSNFTYWYCQLRAVAGDPRTSRCSFDYTATTTGNTRIYGVYTADDGTHLRSTAISDVIVSP